MTPETLLNTYVCIQILECLEELTNTVWFKFYLFFSFFLTMQWKCKNEYTKIF